MIITKKKKNGNERKTSLHTILELKKIQEKKFI